MLPSLAALLTWTTSMHAERLRTEYLVEPLAVATTRPRFSWECEDDRPGARQSAYQIVVASGGTVVWDTGQVRSDRQNQVEYAGRELASREECTWKVRLWDADGDPGAWNKATFRIGLLKPSDWTADWVTTPDPVPAVVPAHNGYHSTWASTPETVKSVVLDLGQSRSFDRVRLWPAHPYDWPDAAHKSFLFPVRFRIETSDEPGFSSSRTIADQTAEDFAAPNTGPVELVTPGASGRFLRLVVTRLAERDTGRFAFALAEWEVVSGGENVARGAGATATDSIENNVWSVAKLVDGDSGGHPVQGLDSLPVTYLRHEFHLDQKVKRAVLYATALGAYEARINGQRVGDHVLAPEWTDYTSRVQVQAYDVKKSLRVGANAIGALLGDGWYAGRIGMAQALDPRGYPRAVYGRRAWFRCQLEVEFEDGSTRTFSSGPEWSASTEGPVRTSDVYDGEVWDLGRPFEGWDSAGFAAKGWTPVAATASTPGGGQVALVPQPNEPIRVVDRLKPVGVSEPKPGVYVLDMGQNMVGWLALKLTAQAGSVVRLHYAEMLNDDGTVYTANLRGAPQVDTVEFPAGGAGLATCTFRPHFTYHGFRYVQIEGLARRPRPQDVTGEVFCSSAPETASFSCSDPMVNKLWSNIFWTQRANLMSCPTDCPQRDERLGWMGDILAFSQNAYFNMDLGGFFTKWLQDVRDAQADDGRYPDFAPHPYGKNDRFTGVPGWGDAGVVCAWVHYLNTGDTRLVAEHYASAKRWVDWIASKNPDFLWKNDRHNDYGDWLNGNTLVRDGWDHTGGEVPKDVFATMMWHQSVEMVAEMAAVLGRTEDVRRLRETGDAIRAAFNKAYVQPDGEIMGDTQAGYALALHLGMLPEGVKAQAFAKLVAAIDSRGGVLTTGFHSTLPMMKTLTAMGRNDLAYKLLLNKDFPSWGYTIENGATTIWERWDGYVKGRGFQDPGMNSFNHWALGSVGEWVMETVGGIRLGERGWQEFEIAPRPGPGVDWARASYRSPFGTVKVAWKRKKGGYSVSFTVPPNTRARVVLPPGTALAKRAETLGLAPGHEEGTFTAAAGTYEVDLTARE